MKNLILILLLILCSCKSSIINKDENLVKIVKSYLEFRENNGTFNKEKDIIVIGAQNLENGNYWVEIAFDNVNYLYDRKYKNLYTFNGYKIILFEELDKSYLFEKIFKKLPYENLNKAKFSIDYSITPWHILLNKENEIISIQSQYLHDDVFNILQKNEVKFSKDYKK